MAELRIFAEQEEGFLIPISAIVRIIFSTRPDLLNGEWIFQYKDMGLGGPDFEINGTEITPKCIEFNGQSEFKKFLNQDFFLDFGEFRRKDGKFVMGVFDSSFIYIKSDEKYLSDIASKFNTNEIEWHK